MALLDYGKRDGYGLSYSRLLTLNLCPRKFQLENIFGLAVRESNTTFAFGHAVGAGVQALVEHGDLNRALLSVMTAWDVGMYDEEHKSKKSLWYAVRATQRFYDLISDPASDILRDYEIATFVVGGERKSAIELTFNIICDDGYEYEGHVDLILKEKKANKYLILELKTTGFSNIDEAMFGKSAQAIGYSIVLDSIAADVGGSSSYSVLYLVYKSGKMEYEPLVFNKTPIERAKWVNNLILDIEQIKMYRDYGVFPARGQACYNYFRRCEYYDTCGMSDDNLTRMSPQLEADSNNQDGEVFAELLEHDFTYHLDEIIQRQSAVIQESQIPAMEI